MAHLTKSCGYEFCQMSVQFSEANSTTWTLGGQRFNHACIDSDKMAWILCILSFWIHCAVRPPWFCCYLKPFAAFTQIPQPLWNDMIWIWCQCGAFKVSNITSEQCAVVVGLTGPHSHFKGRKMFLTACCNASYSSYLLKFRSSDWTEPALTLNGFPLLIQDCICA